MKKFLISFFSILLVVILPIVGFFIYGGLQPAVYGETYYAELKDKIVRLETRENQKIVFIGGSSLIFGLRSEEIEKATGYDVVDFGLYASLGTPIMMRLAKDYIKENDVVILAPEINPQTYSSYIGYDAALKCFENMNYPFWKFNMDENMNFFFKYFKYVIDKGSVNIELNPPYDKASFNEYCDIDNEIVANNILEDYYDSTQMIAPDKNIFDDGFINEVNNFYNDISRKGAKMFFSFSPTNALALDKSHLDEFEKSLSKHIKCPVLGSVEDFTYHQYYFYDTNFHLNRTGSYLHSKTMSDLLKEALQIENSYVIPTSGAPDPKYKKTNVVDKVDGISYQQIYVSNKLCYSIIEIDEEYKNNLTSFEIPEFVNGIQVVSVGSLLFSDMPNLTKVVIPSSIFSLDSPLFYNCPNLISLYLKHTVPPLVMSNGLLEGASAECRIYVPAAAIRTYANDYNWYAYRDRLTKY